MRAAAWSANLVALGSCVGGGYEWDAGKHGMSIALFGICSVAMAAALGYDKRAKEGK